MWSSHSLRPKPRLLPHSFILLFVLSIIAHFPLIVARPTAGQVEQPVQPVCKNPAYDPFDYSVKAKPRQYEALNCPNPAGNNLQRRQQVDQDDYSCSESKPCRNGACCSKTSGYCGYGPESCGTDGQSPNDVCWSNCDAKAECGRFAATPGQTCPLNVCCSEYGFCGMSAEFCLVTDDPEKSCQSNCDQPGSGGSNGNVQDRIIGYYEGWVANRACNGMSIEQIPVSALTHLYFSFGYITPGSYDVVPMDGLDPAMFTQMTNLKRKNSGLKVIVALGGWTFNDNGTATQPVFSEICASAGNRSKFIGNLLGFLKYYAFDGVDFDWEYPGAPDRGGQANDGANFVLLLKELKEAIAREPVNYIVSFTTPTSYWYLRHFDLTAADYVDWINVMSYDLHGVWDAWNPIGSHVLGHTNLTEIQLALDLYWRNGVPANKLNLGLGFYSRTFQLSDPGCFHPGCSFKAGASPGVCTGNSGTLAYFEIQDIIKSRNIQPYYDEAAQVKYIVWDNDQWASYDDRQTFQAKIAFANQLGLGGLLVWSIDQDTIGRDALQAILGEKGLAAFKNSADNAAYWQSLGAQDCYVTDCGGTCNPGFIKLINQPCGDATFLFRHSSKADSALCCPISAAPDPAHCRWRGTAPSCNGHCEDNEVAVELNRWGDGKYCESGNKAYCCENQGVKNTCYWTGVGGSCNAGDQPLTFAGTFLETVADIFSLGGLFGSLLSDALDSIDMDLRKLYCCPPDMMSTWTNCRWHGEPGSCFDNHCDLGHQVQVAQSDYGGGQSCAPRLERTRVLCCDAASGKSPFLPVPLEYLFPSLPTGADINTEFDLQVDNTWGDGIADTSGSNDPNNAAFAFWVMTGPEQVQQSLSKRDGSHWELFNCNDAVSEEAQTVQMVCTDASENSNCHKIGLGDGVPGTILTMPEGQGCGPAKYAVAKSMTVSKNQTLPHHLRKRGLGHKPVVYDLTFDYEWKRVPRAYGDTQVRVDFSNEVGYWDTIVDKAAASKKKKRRSLVDVGGNHRRWLEEEWRDDAHFGGLSSRELHERWFGQDILDWLRSLLSVEISPTYSHNYDDSITAVILQDSWTCNLDDQGIAMQASIEAKASAQIQVSSSFGMTIITSLATLDMSNSYLFMRSRGGVSAIFTVDANAKAAFSSGEFNLATLPFPGASFTIPKLLTLGPKFVLKAQADANVEIDGHFEARVDIASWDIQQTYPQQGADFNPKSLTDPQRAIDTQGLQAPVMDLSITANGQLTAHLIPTLSFGISFDSSLGIGDCAAELLVDGWVRARAELDLVGGDASCPYRYAIDAGSKVVARATVPPTFNWSPSPLEFFAVEKNIFPGDGSNWACPGGSSTKRWHLDTTAENRTVKTAALEVEESHTLSKRGAVYGPLFHLPITGEMCASASTELLPCSEVPFDDEDDPAGDSDALARRSIPAQSGNGHHGHSHSHLHELSKRGNAEMKTFCSGNAKMQVTFPAYPNSGAPQYDNQNWDVCDNLVLTQSPGGQSPADFEVEHILEKQLLTLFFDENYTTNPKSDVCKRMQPFWTGSGVNYVTYNGLSKLPINHVAYAYPSTGSHDDEFVLLRKRINGMKSRLFGGRALKAEPTYTAKLKSLAQVQEGMRSLKIAILLYAYMSDPVVFGAFVEQARRIGTTFDGVEAAMVTYHATRNVVYSPIGLGTPWTTWIKAKSIREEARLIQFMRDSITTLNTAWRPPGQTPPANRQVLVTNIANFETAINAIQANRQWLVFINANL